MSRRQRIKRRAQGRGRGARTALFAVGLLAVFAALGAAGVVGWVVSVASSAPNIDSLKPADKGSVSQVYASDGRRLGFIESTDLRTPITDRQIPDVIKEATIAVEDERFWTHEGVDYEGVVRAAIKNVETGSTVEGGSTITMQLVRNLYISNEQTFERKIREAKLAQELEQEHSKKWILDRYLNSVPYGTVGGQSAIGIEAASRLFFAKRAKNLRLPEAALLAGLPQAPSQYNPFAEPVAAKRRRNQVLRLMLDQDMITAGQYRRAARSKLRVKENSYYQSRRESYFFDYVKQELIDRYGVNTVRRGGLKVHTTVDLELQKAARNAINSQLNYSGDPASAIVTVDPRNGYIRAMASSGKYKSNKFNLAAQGHRQPGSTFKTMVLMAALRRGVDPRSTTYQSKPLNLNSSYGPWKVSTYSHSYGGTMDIVKATLTSDNTVYAQMILDLGPKAVKRAAKDMGIRSKLEGYPAEGLGGLEKGVSPLEMANAYATLANGGVRHRPIAIKKVEFADGKSERLDRPKRKRTFDDAVAHEATKILEKNIDSGTGTAADIGCPAAGKTGTTDEFSDAWFVGYTPRLATAVWVGYPNKRRAMRSVHGISVAGGTFPARIWGNYMRTAKRDFCGGFRRPNSRFKSSPFYGKYARTGSSSDDGSSSGGGTNDGGTGAQGFERSGGGGGGGGRSGGRGGRYDSRLYESPPQEAPDVG